MYKILFHVDDKDQIDHAIGNVLGVSKDMEDAGDQFQIEVVANGTGVFAFTEDANENIKRIKSFLKDGIKIAVCRNSLTKFEIEDNELIDGINIVATAVGELVRKQANGWAYIKL